MADYKVKEREEQVQADKQEKKYKHTEWLIAKDVSHLYKGIKKIEFCSVGYTKLGDTEFVFIINDNKNNTYSYTVNGDNYNQPTAFLDLVYPISVDNEKENHKNDDVDFKNLKIIYSVVVLIC